MIALFIAVLVAVGIGGTAIVSDNARPGDALFGIDQAVENVRISLAGKEKKNKLRVRFAEERIKEVRELKEEGDEADDSAESLTDEEDENITTSIESALDLLTDLDEAEETDNALLEGLADDLTGYLENLPADARVQVSDDRLRIKFEGGPEKIEIKDQGDDKTKIDVRTEEGRLRVEVKDGQIEIKTKLEESENNDSSDDTTTGLDEAEAKILSDKTIIEVEIGDEKTTFASSAVTREEIIAAIIAKFPSLSAEEVGAILKIETEDSDEEEVGDQDDDLNDDSDEDEIDDVDDEDIEDDNGDDEDNNDEDSSNDDNDESEDEDNSGSGSEDDR
ncbi:MAG: hypothetical protein US50_C0016G0016 [Candidatus Nomurabacteria bacterium GW2011_GWB1_37_5]|uniref:DUF5667 domain-containing protein n=1 Tax=Candidatus Nomurabacteria bacterium GW2011_GWB1_37_5 TaxID=1618742 RepID=A0A0G0K424_9BACT|nr:MAG: hypothetical protein US50_C0016G0016 [Candidatus Nomurabacteria bacterium GW2011_GWB1_37_5]